MGSYGCTLGQTVYRFEDLKTLLAKATPARSGDELAGIAARSPEERVAAQMALADLPLATFLSELVVLYDKDEVTRLIVDEHDSDAFAPVAGMCVGEFRDWLLSDAAHPDLLGALAPGITPEMAAAVSKIMRLQDLVTVAAKIRVVTRFRNTLGLAGRLSTELHPNPPTDAPVGIAASIIDGLTYGSGDAVIGINPVSDNVASVVNLTRMLDHIRATFEIPTQTCVLAHVTTQMEAMRRGAPVDLAANWTDLENHGASTHIQGNRIYDPLDATPIRIANAGNILVTDNVIRSRAEVKRGPVIHLATPSGDADMVALGNTFTVAKPFDVQGRLSTQDERILARASIKTVLRS